MIIYIFLSQGVYEKAPLEQHYSPSVSGLVARLLVTDPERRPSAREILESLTDQEEETFFTARTHNYGHNDALSNINESLENISLNTDTLLVTSSGPSAECHGEMLGIYKKAGTHNNCPYYKQMETERSDGKKEVIYRRKKGGWAIGTGLDDYRTLKNASDTESVPLTGWRCWKWDDDKYVDDPQLSISHDQPPACGEITIKASGDAAAQQSKCVGVYTPTEMFSMGRRVFKHQTQERYLLVTPGYVHWSVQESVESEGPRMLSGCAPSLCPADPRARRSERMGYTSWGYKHVKLFGSHKFKRGHITVKCSVHKYL